MANNTFDELMNSDVWKAYEQKMLEKEKHLKRGPKVIHLEYLGPMFSENDIKEYEEKVAEAGLELSRFDKDGVVYASLDKFELVTFVALSQPIVGELLRGIGTNAAWEVIKFLLLSSLKKVKSRFYNRATSPGSEKKEVSFGCIQGINTKCNVYL